MTLHKVTAFIDKVKALHPTIIGIRVLGITSRNVFNPATTWFNDYNELEDYIDGLFYQGVEMPYNKIININIEVITHYAKRELTLNLRET
jgi:hypothetical protein